MERQQTSCRVFELFRLMIYLSGISICSHSATVAKARCQAPPYNLCLDAAGTVAEAIESENYGQADLQGFLIIGGNVAMSIIAFDTRSAAPWPVVTIDMVAGGDSVQVIAPDFDTFCDRIGMEEETA